MSTTPTPPTYEAPFFTSVRGWGITRGRHGFFGGVVEGIGDRIGMERTPARILAVILFLITSGVFLTAYAAAWALLPDKNGRIVAQDFGRGTPNVPAIVGIGIFGLMGLSGLGWYVPFVGGAGVVIAGLFGLLVLVGVVALIGWAISRDPEGHGRYVVEFRATKEAKEAAQAAGREARDAARDAGRDVRDAARSAGVAARHGAAAAGEQARVAAGAAKDAAREAGARIGEGGKRVAAQAKTAAAEIRDAVAVQATPAGSGGAIKPVAVRYPSYPWTPGPGHVVYRLVWSAAFLSAAALWWLDREGELSLTPWATWLAVLVIIVGAGIIFAGLLGRRIGFLGFLAFALISGWTSVILAGPSIDSWLARQHGSGYEEVRDALHDWGIVIWEQDAAPSTNLEPEPFSTIVLGAAPAATA